MTREQELERRLADWLEDGPVTAPTEVVGRALEQTAGRRQRRGVRHWLGLATDPLGRSDSPRRLVRLTTFTAILVALLLTSVLMSIPLGGGPGPAPEMDPTGIRAVAGTARLTDEAATPGRLTRVFSLEVDDPRIDGEAQQELVVLLESETGLHRSRGTMRLENDWGAWEGPIDTTAYPTGEEVELASLAGTDAYEGYTYLYTAHRQTAEAERTVEGAIWPIEPPAMPDPSTLP